MGCSLYFTTTDTHPLVPLDITEAIYLLLPPSSFLSSTDLIAHCAIALQKCKFDLAALHSKVYEARIQAVMKFECDHVATIHDFDFQPGSLILMRYSAIEKSLNHKMRPRYTGPLVVISRNLSGAYILCELDGSVYDCLVTAFHIIPYFARQSILLPDLDQLPDISVQHLQELKASPTADPEALDDDLTTSQNEDLD
ncbi:hypothetical protein EW146_g9565 [Bondarzewia mesenterica]|uniref:Uncharacterized protein n=1 Tax=Bondarzewia mesenterica TaxID=1095465 RepID=A0A4V3XCN9_9AGAM|nr:hypothetical protein EW146_g9565 [Bondarzewia mesenterica]